MNLYQARSRLRNLLDAGSPYRIHSPFIYDLYTGVIRDYAVRPEYVRVEQIRSNLLHDARVINRVDHGSGGDGLVEIRRFVKRSAVSRKTGALLFRLTQHFKPQSILELGTGSGLSTMYMALGSPQARCITLEGCPETARVASELFSRERIKAEVMVGPFEETLPGALQKLERVDFAFIDGHHRERPTLDNFSAIVAQGHKDSVVVIHDIHWSHEMDWAWKTITDDSRVTVTIDLFDVGLVFFRNQAKEHFVLRW